MKKLIERQFARGNTGILPGDNPLSDTTNTDHNLEMKKVAEGRKLHTMAKVHDFLEMWQGSQNIRATQGESCAQNMQMTGVGYISDPEEIVKAPWSLFKHDGAAVFKLLERSPLPPALSAKDLHGGPTQISNISRSQRINRHPVDSDEHSVPERISEPKNWLNWNGDSDNPDDSERDCAADNESDIEPNNGIEDRECPELPDVSGGSNVEGFVWPTPKSKR